MISGLCARKKIIESTAWPVSQMEKAPGQACVCGGSASVLGTARTPSRSSLLSVCRSGAGGNRISRSREASAVSLTCPCPGAAAQPGTASHPAVTPLSPWYKTIWPPQCQLGLRPWFSSPSAPSACGEEGAPFLQPCQCWERGMSALLGQKKPRTGQNGTRLGTKVGLTPPERGASARARGSLPEAPCYAKLFVSVF